MLILCIVIMICAVAHFVGALSWYDFDDFLD